MSKSREKRVDIHRRNAIPWILLAAAVLISIAFYLLMNAHPEKPALFRYILGLRVPTLICMVIACISIGVATLIYWYLFKKTGHNILYIMLIGTVLSSFFGSMQSAMIRVMDPNEYDALLSSLVADFNNVNGEIIFFAIVMLGVLAFLLRKELKLLDVITMGRDQAINLGVDYDNAIRKLLFGVVLCMAVATATIGPVSFLGLIVANMSRQILRTYKHSHLMLGASLMGMLALIGGQMISQHLFHFTVPVSTFVTIAGGIYFLYLLLFKKGAY